MKKYFITVLYLASIVAHAQEADFSIHAKIDKKIVPQKAYLQYVSRGNAIVDSAEIQNGKFSFKGKTDGFTSARIFFDYSKKGFTDRQNKIDTKALYLEPSKMVLNIKDSLKTAELKAGQLNRDFNDYMQFSNALNERLMDIRREAAKNATVRANISKLIDQADKENTIAFANYAKENPNSYFSLDAITYLINKNAAVELIDEAYDKISNENKKTRTGQQLENTIKTNRLTAIGIEAPQFTQNDVNGNAIKLSDYRGKYVLIDFWASWCTPCRYENPTLVKAYNKYKDMNFEILGVSLDNEKQKEAWLKAIKDDGLEWTQVSDLQGWKNEAAILYGVRSIPASYLIDPNGKIIARNLRGPKLEIFLTDLFK